MKASNWLLYSSLALIIVGGAALKVNAANDFSITGSMGTARSHLVAQW
jgi:hypothetical protein